MWFIIKINNIVSLLIKIISPDLYEIFVLEIVDKRDEETGEWWSLSVEKRVQ